MIEAIERPKHGDPERFHANKIKPGRLPGFGDRYEDCGDPIPKFCEHCLDPTTVGRTCVRSQCPRCAPSWVLDRTVSVASRLDAYRRIKQSSEPGHWKFHHVVFSLPTDWAPSASSPREATLDVIKEILGEWEAEGFAFLHGYRGADEADDFEDVVDEVDAEPTDYIVDESPEEQQDLEEYSLQEASADDLGEWKNRLFKGRSWDDVSEELKWSPHFHVIVCAPEIPVREFTAEIYEATGWIIHRIERNDGSGVSIGNDYDLCRATSYSLSHTSVFKTKEGNNSAFYRGIGPMIGKGNFTVFPDNEARIDRIARAVAPDTLGIPFAELACTTRYKDANRVDGVDLDRAQGVKKTGILPEATTSSSSSSSGDLPEEPDPFDEESSVDDPDPIDSTPKDAPRCEGRLLHISNADEYLDNPEQVENPIYLGELKRVYREYLGVPAGADLLDDDPPPD